jgi:adenosyl cobinamide kinase/adenosyl cobinamide phosphate guanylyltransferase
MLTFLLGGARSGKSALALELARAPGAAVTFVATAEALDEEMAERIERHRAERPRHFTTLEEPIELEAVLAGIDEDEVIVLDCLTLWVSYLFGRGLESEIDERARRLATAVAERRREVIVISNEVGWGIVPADELSRAYRDALGRVNALFAQLAAPALLVVAGLTLTLSTAKAPQPTPHHDSPGSP